jgi:hypothetical protein
MSQDAVAADAELEKSVASVEPAVAVETAPVESPPVPAEVPVGTAPAPVEPTPAPVVTAPAPVEPTPAPVVTAPAPVEPTPAPVVAAPVEPAPVVVAAPVVTASDADAVAPAASAPTTSFTAAEPAASVTAAATGEVDSSSLGFLSGGSVRGRWKDLGGGNSKPTAVAASVGAAKAAAAKPSDDAAAEGADGGDAAAAAAAAVEEKKAGGARTAADITVTIKGETFSLAQLVAARKGKEEGVLATIDFDLKHSCAWWRVVARGVARVARGGARWCMRRVRALTQIPLSTPAPALADLSEADFEFLFGMHIDQFLALPQWKQTAARKKFGLF